MGKKRRKKDIRRREREKRKGAKEGNRQR